MSEVLPAENLPEGMAARILNMRLDSDGGWKAVLQPAMIYPQPFEGTKVFAWKPVYMPADADAGQDTVYIVFYSDGTVGMVYKSTSAAAAKYTATGADALLFDADTAIIWAEGDEITWATA